MALGWLNRLQGRATDQLTGLPLKTPTIAVYLAGTQTLVPLFTTNTGLTPMANPFLADVNGFYQCYPNALRVDIQITPTPGCGNTYTLGDVQPLTPYYLTGADPTGVIDATPIFQQAVNLGGLILIPPGQYKIASTITISNPVRLVGCGRSWQNGGPLGTCTILQAATVGFDMFHVNSDGVSFEHLFLSRAGSSNNSTDGDAIVVGFVGSVNSYWANFIARDLEFLGHNAGIHLLNAAYYTIDNCNFLTCTPIIANNLLAPDSGDSMISNCIIFSSSPSGGRYGLEYLAGGGLKISNCKFLGGQACININWNTGTSIGPKISNCSFENWITNGIVTMGSDTILGLSITGCQIDNGGHVGGAQSCLSFANVQQLVVSGCNFSQPDVTSDIIVLTGISDFMIGMNTIVGGGAPVPAAGIAVDATSSNGVIGPNLIVGCTTPVSVAGGATNVQVMVIP